MQKPETLEQAIKQLEKLHKQLAKTERKMREYRSVAFTGFMKIIGLRCQIYKLTRDRRALARR